MSLRAPHINDARLLTNLSQNTGCPMQMSSMGGFLICRMNGKTEDGKYSLRDYIREVFRSYL